MASLKVTGGWFTPRNVGRVALMGLSVGLLLVVGGEASAAFADAGSSSAQNLVQNGDFAVPNVGTGYELFSSGQKFIGWNVIGTGNVGVTSGAFTQNGLLFRADGSNQWLDLTGTSNSAAGVSQAIRTVSGSQYTLRFSVGNVYNPTGIFGVTSTIRVLVDGRQILKAENALRTGGITQVWMSFSATFTASTASTTIDFFNADPSDDTSNGLDDVRVTGAQASSPQSTFATSLPPIDKAFPLDRHTLINALVTVTAMALITFPAQLFNRTLDENHDEIRAMVARRAPLLVKARRRVHWRSAHPSASAFFAVLVLGSVIGGFNDPSFGVGVKSLETLIAVMAAFVASITVTGAISREYRRRRGLDAAWKPHAVPAGLLVAVVSVFVSRLTHFEPGYLYGVIAGVVFTTPLSGKALGHETSLSSLAGLVLAVVSWIVWTPLHRVASGAHPNFVVLIADTFLAGLFVSGVVGAVINLLPLEFLPGAAIARWHKAVWAAIFSVAVFLLVQVMLVPSARSSRLGDAPFVTTIVLFGVFGAGSIGLHQYFAARHRRSPSPDTGGAAASDEVEENTTLGSPQSGPGSGMTETGPR